MVSFGVSFVGLGVAVGSITGGYRALLRVVFGGVAQVVAGDGVGGVFVCVARVYFLRVIIGPF